jgi:transcriptional regulator with XRE-family HTH domain
MDFNRFKTRCKEKGYSPTSLAEKMGISRSNVTNWKSGGNPSIETLIQISELLECSIDYLLGLDPIPQRASELTEYIPVKDKEDEIKKTVMKALDMYFFFERQDVKTKLYGGIENE